RPPFSPPLAESKSTCPSPCEDLDYRPSAQGIVTLETAVLDLDTPHCVGDATAAVMANITSSAPPGYGNGSLKIPEPLSWGAVALGLAFVACATACSLLRFRRLNDIRSRYKFPDRASLSRMTHADAQAIAYNVSSFEFPLFYDLALRYALFKTYAIENIAKLLFSASDLAKYNHAPKSFVLFPPSSPLLHMAVARMNHLHAPYIKSKGILNQDLLYVLNTAMVEPIRFMRLYEWRSLTEMEVAAQAMLWKCVGDMMGIDYAEQLGKNEWNDSIEFMEDLTRWGCKYEDSYMLPLLEVRHLGTVLMDLLLSAYPKTMRPLGYQMLLVLFDFPKPGVAILALTYVLLLSRQIFVRYLALPRFYPMRYVADPDPKTGRMHHTHYLREPWYTPATLWARWGPVAWVTRAAGGMIPGDGGAEMKPEGFLFEELGPRCKMGKGLEETALMEEQAKVVATRTGDKITTRDCKNYLLWLVRLDLGATVVSSKTPTIPVYSSSPINASKASGVTPHTKPPEGSRPNQETPETRTAPSGQQTYPPAKPGAVPSLPVQTAAPQPFASIQPTPTSSTQTGSPPAPQPGAVPVPPRGVKYMPPPPKAGESGQHAQPPQTTTMPMPPQMSYKQPIASQPIQGRSSTTTAVPATQIGGPYPTSLQEQNPASYSHPPGYQQNVLASEFNSYQRAAHHASVDRDSRMMPSFGQDGEPGVWDSAKKWAAAAGESLAAAENEVWKRINKD
ncbi:hypothetical protein TOPH_07382, partial [Tolypocladium ophioglossoides CBS 100239]